MSTKEGLVTTDRNNLDPAAAPFAKNPRDLEGLTEGASIIEVVKKVRPHVLLGLSGVGGIFNEEVLKAMKESVSTKPAIFAMSSPTMNAECTAIDAFKHAGGDIVFGSGSPFENVDLDNEKVGHVNQANNMYLFLGIGLGSLLSGARLITDGMLQAAAECLASYMLEEDIAKGILYPSIDSIRNVTAEVGAAVLRAAVEENLAEGHGDVGPKELGRRHGMAKISSETDICRNLSVGGEYGRDFVPADTGNGDPFIIRDGIGIKVLVPWGPV
ncbi:NAD-dependent malic enzyme 2, mitochondrial [Arachis duranensis]|uniref:NAD-dependent malic enzyme 2, mitochondrial n=1 Tax=Arachis duranensis TaxID=130453 RepID=A0A6P4C5R4_ARADU|nr:NAD-dependent malic enzyme 2, mitochondrial [Arachis duranensis]